MKKYLKNIPSALAAGEKGQALILVLIFVLLGSLTVIPSLALMSTTLKTGVAYENKTNELYTADAGIENGLWRIKYDALGPTYDVYDYTTVWTYETDPVNNRTAEVSIKNVWIPTNVTLASLGITPAAARTMVESEKLVVTGTPGVIPGHPYSIKMEFDPDTDDNLTIKSIGIWLPQDFTYTAGSSDLEKTSLFNPCHPDDVSVSEVPGGQSVVWSYNSPYPALSTFPNFTSDNSSQITSFEFEYSPPAATPERLPLAVAWVVTDGVTSVPVAWDTDARFYEIISESGKTRIETYSTKSQLRKLGDAIAGDYVAVGNSLMIGNVEKRDNLLASSAANVSAISPIPEDADVISAILYWSGFRLATTSFSDACNDFTNWTRSEEIRLPESDGTSAGTWTCSPSSPATLWDKVDETSPDDGDYIIGSPSGSGNYYQLFVSSNFTIPDESTITDITIYYRAKDQSNGNNNIRAYIKAGGSYDSGSSVNPSLSWTTYSYSFTTNPSTGLAWTVDDINGSGSNPLQYFGVYSSDLNPAVDVSMVYAQVNYSLWTIQSDYWGSKFQGQGNSSTNTEERTLTLKDGIDLSSYTPNSMYLYWAQTTGGTLESDDMLYYAMSGDGGNTWSSNMEAFHGSNPSSPFYVVIPSQYMTDNFKFRFYFTLDSSSEYVYLDNIKILSMPADTSVNFEINGQQVYLDAGGDPQAGEEKLNASSSAILINEAGVDSDKTGYSYACHVDVSKLVKKYPEVLGEEHHTGNAEYTVGDVTADTGQYVSYAGWSLIIIYCSPDTAGHYLYLNDIYAFDPGNINLDFDRDGQPGGDITGFIIPEPIKDRFGVILESIAAKITCFVGEGDAIYSGDSLMITGEQSGNSKYLNNSASPTNNVWNGIDTISSYPGIDIDTFTLLWSDDILIPKDTHLHLDMNSGTDAWNLIYVIISVRSETVTGGTENYVITGIQIE
jgi:hypothetical protein